MSGNCGTLSGGSGDLIVSHLGTMTSFGTSAYNDAIRAINEIKDAMGGGPSEAGISAPGGWWGSTLTPAQSGSIKLIKPSPIPTTTGISFNAPSAPTLVLDGLDEVDEVLQGIIQQLQDLMEQTPEFKDIDVSDRFLELLGTHYEKLTNQLNSILRASGDVGLINERLSARIAEQLSTESVGMPAEVVQAKINQAKDQLTQQANQAVRQAADEWAARGFSLPSGAMDAKIAAVWEQSGDKLAEHSRTIFIEAVKWEQEVRQFAIEKGLQYQDALRATFFKHYEMSKSIAETWQEQHIKVSLAQVEVYKARIQAWGQTAEALGRLGSTAAITIKAKIDEQMAFVEVYKAKLMGEAERVGTELKIADTDTKIFVAKLEAEKEAVMVQLKLEDQDLELKKLDTSIDLKNKELELIKLSEVTKVSIAALDGIARTASQLAAGALSALHMSASLSTSTGYSSSIGCSTSYNYDM